MNLKVLLTFRRLYFYQNGYYLLETQKNFKRWIIFSIVKPIFKIKKKIFQKHFKSLGPINFLLNLLF